MRAWLEKRLQPIWYEGASGATLLAPLSWAYAAYIKRVRNQYASGKKTGYRPPVPVVVVGNLVTGGTGKTPLVLAICSHLQALGWQPGILSRGYGSSARSFPIGVRAGDSARDVGDEPLLMAQRNVAKVCIDPQRSRGAHWLIDEGGCNIIVCDDGLQHYALARDVELAVIDAQRQLGNRRCLPAGPLREPVARLNSVNFIVHNGGKPAGNGGAYSMRLQPSAFVGLKDDERLPIENLADISANEPVHAVTGIGNPQRFFTMLKSLGLQIHEHVFPDHHRYCPADLQFDDAKAIIMTEKDAVKCREFALPNAWYVPVEACLEDSFFSALMRDINDASTQVN